MNNTFSPRSVTNSLRRAKPPGESEFHALFQLLPGPALLLDMAREQIVLANSPFLQLTAFSLSEVSGKALNELVGELPAHPLTADETITVTLERRKRPALALNAQVRVLDAAGHWLALLFTPEEDLYKSLASRIDRLIKAMEVLYGLSADMPMRENAERILKIVLDLLDGTSVGVYRMQSGEPQLWKVAEVMRHAEPPPAAEPGEETSVEQGNLLPDMLPASDLLRLSQTFIWRPGRRVQTELHRTARINNLTYLASTPIEQNGLLVVAENRSEPLTHLTTAMDMLGKLVGLLLGQITRVKTLRHHALENHRELAIWRSVGENAQEGILLLSPDLTVSEMNPAAEWMLGYADWEVQGQPVENILIGPERLQPALEMACQGLPTHNMGNVSLHRRNGQSFPAHVQIVPVQREGETLSILISFSDVSEHVEIRNRTQQLEQRAVLGEVTAVFAHEVRNPINNISTGLQLLSVQLPPDDHKQENITRLLNDCQRLNHLMESVLNFSRQVEHKFEEVDVDMLLNRLLDRWRPRMAKVNVTAYFQMEPGTSHVLADPRSLEQVFTNLVGNAVEAMSSNGGTLAVRVAPFPLLPGRPQVEVTVSDNGPGIPDEIRDRIFEPFVTTKSQGTGLGLAITKRIVTAHHGSISVNTFPGGTVFHVFLPAYEGERA